MRNIVPLLLGLAMLLLGLAWIGQGTGLIGGTAMSGQAIWTVIGAALVVGAAALVAWTTRRTSRD